MLSAYFVRQSRAHRRMILGLLKLGAFGLLITVSIRMHDAVTYFLIAAMLLLAMIYGSLRILNEALNSAGASAANRYRLAWLSARRRAVVTRVRLEFLAHRSWN